jgi:hypothetical protein
MVLSDDLAFAMTGDLYVSDSVIEDLSLEVTRFDDCPESSVWESRPPLPLCCCWGLESESSKSPRAKDEEAEEAETDIEEPPRVELVEMAAGAVRGRACGRSYHINVIG